MKKTTLIVGVLVLALFAVSVYYYPQMPSQVVSHWNINGEPNGYLDKFWGVFLLPIITLGITLLFYAIPYIDPLRRNIESFRGYYNGLVILFVLFMILIQAQILLWGLGVQLHVNVLVPLGIGLLFFTSGCS